MGDQPTLRLSDRIHEAGVAIGVEVVEGAARDARPLADVMDADSRGADLGAQLAHRGDEPIALRRQPVGVAAAAAPSATGRDRLSRLGMRTDLRLGLHHGRGHR